MPLTRFALSLISLLVPPGLRPRWREEWQAELNHARSQSRSLRDRLGMAAGSVQDAVATRRISMAAGRTGGARAGIFHGLDQDLRYALRGLARSPGFTVGAIASLSIGIAATAGAFTLLNAFVFSASPEVTDQDRLARIAIVRPDRTIASTFDKYETLKRGLTTVSGIAAHHDTGFAVGRVAVPVDVPGAIVSGDYFAVLGVRPAAGRFFAPEEDGVPWAAPAAVISSRLWRRVFGASDAALNQWITINGSPVRIVGVAPAKFAGLRGRDDATDVWIPFALSDLVLRDASGRPAHVRHAGRLDIDYIGRLAPGATLEDVRAQAGALQAELSGDDADPGAARVVPIRRGSGPRTTPMELAAVMAVPMIVLAIACVNAANLMLARASRRGLEWRLRLALGSSRWRIVRQILAESLIVSLLASAAGLVLTYWSLGLHEGILLVALEIDWRVLAFTLAIAAMTAVAFGIGPAISTTRAAAMRAPSAAPEGTRPGQRRVRMGLVALQAALSLGLLLAGTQFLSALRERANDDGLSDPERLLVASFDVSKLRYTESQTREFYARLMAGARTLPGVTASAVANGDFWRPTPWTWQLQTWLPGDPPATPKGTLGVYTAGDLFVVLENTMREGRAFVPGDHTGRPRSVIVNEVFAQRFFEGRALGRTVRIASGEAKYEHGHEVSIVGVLSSPAGRRGDRRLPIVYYPVPLDEGASLKLLLRLNGPPAAAARGLRDLVRRLDDRLPIAALTTGTQMREEWGGEKRWLATATAVLGAAAFVLAAAGLFSVVAYVVALRRREIGIRMTLGANGSAVVAMILRQALIPTAVGCAAGAVAAAVAAQIVNSQVYGASPLHPVTFAGTAGVMIAVMALASIIPASRAARVDPMTVLRQE
jgi:putative ABC transport system permease protein